MLAEESTAWDGVTRATSAGGLGFGFKWNMGWMHDSLAYIRNEPVHRVHHHGQLAFPLVYAFAENYVLPLSHDEVVHGEGDRKSVVQGKSVSVRVDPGRRSVIQNTTTNAKYQT